MGNIKQRVQYVIDDAQLKRLIKDLGEVDKKTNEINKTQPDLSPGVGKSNQALQSLKGTIAGLGIAALITTGIKKFAELSEEIQKSRKQVAQLTGESGEMLDIITARVRATSQTFDKEFNEVLLSANAVAANLGISMTETMDGINEAMAAGVDVNGEYLETIKEYSPFMKQAGIDFDQFNALIQKQLTDGVFSDKGIDAIKEAVISIQEMTPATEDALKAAGINTKQLIKDIEDGSKTYFEVVQEIGKNLENITDQRVRGQVLADIFRGAGEDAGNYALSLHEVGTELAALTPEQEKARDAAIENVEANEKLNEQLLILTNNWGALGTVMGTWLTSVAGDTLRWFNELLDPLAKGKNEIADFRKQFEKLNEQDQAAKLEELKNKYDDLNDVLAEGNRVQKEGGFFERLFGEFNPERIEGTKEEIKEVVQQVQALDQIEKDRLAEQAQQKQEQLNQKLEAEAAARAKAAKEAREQAKADRERIDALRKINEAETDEKTGEAKSVFGDESKGLPGDEDSEFIKGVEAQEERLSIMRDNRVEAEKKLADDLKEINKEILEDTEETELLKTERTREEIEARNQLISDSLNLVADIYQNFSDLRIQQIQSQIDANEIARNRELELAEGNAAEQDRINQEYDRKQRELKQKQAKEEKSAALFRIAVATATAVISALASIPPNVPLSIFAGITGAAQAAFVLAQPLPKFAKGVIDLQGAGSETSDSIPAMLSRRESVMTAQETIDFKPTLEAIRSRSIDPEVLNALALGKQMPDIVVNDYDKLAQAVKSQPKHNISLDRSGFSYYMHRQTKRMQYKQNKYSMD